jgi:hypothetical protein
VNTDFAIEPAAGWTTAWAVEGVVCEFYAAPGQIIIGEDMGFDEAERFCVAKHGGHLFSIHNQQDYDKLKAATAGYTKPVLVGLRSDAAGNWEWTDGSAVGCIVALYVSLTYLLTYSVLLFLKRQCDRTLGGHGLLEGALLRRPAGHPREPGPCDGPDRSC